MSRPVNLQLIADDYGLGELHNKAICELISIDAISGTSVMVELCSKSAAHQLVESRLDHQLIGLHFNLSQPTILHPKQITRNTLLLTSPLVLNRSLVRKRLAEQWQLFIDLFGFEPNYIDGHEHVHQFFGLQNIVAQFAASKAVPVRATCLLPSFSGLKNQVINFLGRTFQATAKQNSVATNDYFLGVLPLNKPSEAEVELKAQLKCAFEFAETNPDKSLTMMVHPGSAEDATQVEGHAAEMRSIEYRVLKELVTSGRS